jgi:hypothetical protein
LPEHYKHTSDIFRAGICVLRNFMTIMRLFFGGRTHLAD